MQVLKQKRVIGGIIGLLAAILGATTGVELGALVAPITEVTTGVVQ